MSDEGQKLPKQWRDWIKSSGMKSTYSSNLSRKYGDFYFKGHGRFWRLDCLGYLDMSEPFDSFDRWANSCEMSRSMTAKNKPEFLALIASMTP